jgi:hypothetical protein
LKTFAILLLCFLGITISNANPPEKNIKKQLKGFRLIPVGKAIVNDRETKVAEFYISETEVSNQSYLKSLFHLKQNGNEDELIIADIDTTNWKVNNSKN